MEKNYEMMQTLLDWPFAFSEGFFLPWNGSKFITGGGGGCAKEFDGKGSKGLVTVLFGDVLVGSPCEELDSFRLEAEEFTFVCVIKWKMKNEKWNEKGLKSKSKQKGQIVVVLQQMMQ